MILVRRLSFAYTVPVLESVDLHFNAEWTGLVGANGSGKTTILTLITGEIQPSSGTITFTPKDPIIRYCPQGVERINDDILAFSRSTDHAVRRIFGSLALDASMLDRWSTLSPGERKRWQLGAALASDPDILLLDEPTNHVDGETRNWLIHAMRRFKGVGIVVAHDRGLLDALTASTMMVGGGTVRSWPGPYGRALEAWTGERARAIEKKQKADAENVRVRAALREGRSRLEAASKSKSAGSRMRNTHDSDARSIAQTGRAASAEKRLGQVVARLADRAEDAHAAQENLSFAKELGSAVFANYVHATAAWLMYLEGDLTWADRTLPIPTAIGIGRDTRLWIRGPNGSGKSTLLRALLTATRVPRSRITYLPQDVTEFEAFDLLETIKAMPSEPRGRVLSIVAALGVDPESVLATHRPSCGEVRKLLIALGLGSHAWALVLDEPTNHLDLPSRERLERAVAGFPGALVVVTHDEAFAANARLTTEFCIAPAARRG